METTIWNDSRGARWESGRRRGFSLALGLGILGAIAIAGGAWALPTYAITDLGFVSGQTSSVGFGINTSGLVVGSSGSLPAYFSGGAATEIGTGSGTAYGVNDEGVVVGGVGSPPVPFYYVNGSVVLTPLPAGVFDGEMRGFNRSGQEVIGYFFNGSFHEHAYFGSNGNATDIGFPVGATDNFPSGINDSGLIVGTAQFTNDHKAYLYDSTAQTYQLLGSDSNGNALNQAGDVTGYTQGMVGVYVNAFIYKNGNTQLLGTLPGDLESMGYGINATDEVVGLSTDDAASMRAFLYSAATGMIDLNTLLPAGSGWVLIKGAAINDAGQITGYGTLGGETHAFLLSPPSEAGKAPSVTVLKFKKKTPAAKLLIKGTAAGNVTKVTFQDKKHHVLIASGTNAWKYKVKLKPGKNKFIITATGPGGASKPVTITIIRLAP